MAYSASSPLTVERIVAASRALLVEGGPGAVVIREVARRLAVTAPALYRYVAGRDELLTLLITACSDEMTDVCAAAADAETDPEARLRAATWAFRCWAGRHPAEFALLYGAPIPGYTAPVDGPTTTSRRRFSDVFARLFADLLQAGLLRTVPDEDLPPAVAADLAAYAAHLGVDLSPGQLHPFVVGWHRMLGIVSVEVSGHLRWVFPDAEEFVREQLVRLADDLIHRP